MRTSVVAALLVALSAVNAAPVAGPDANSQSQFEVIHVVYERDPDLPVHMQEKRQVTITITETINAESYVPTGHTHTVTRTVRRTQQPSDTPSAAATSFPSSASGSGAVSMLPSSAAFVAAEEFQNPTTSTTSTSSTTPPPAPQVITEAAPAAAPTTTQSSNSNSNSGSSSSSDSSDPISQSVLDAHNQYRSQHSAPALTWDDTLASYAQSHASSCVFQHTGGPYGENLAAGYSSVEASIAAWYNEISDYNFGDPGFSESTGHFTQVVWVGSTSVGCAWISCNTASTPGYYLMCEYSPAGNVIGEFAQNVLQN